MATTVTIAGSITVLEVETDTLLITSQIGPQGPQGPEGDVTPEALAAQDAAELAATNAGNSAQLASDKAQLATTQAGIATTQAGLASGHASTATTQAGIATTQAGLASGFASTATTQAGIATTQAGLASGFASTATTQAGIATTQAGLASGFASTATTQAGIATTQAGLASGSAQAASGSAQDATTQAGIATGAAQDAYTSEINAYDSAYSASESAFTATTQADLASGFASTATTQADLASGFSSTASTSATAAANAIAAQFKGGVAGASVPATSTAAGDRYAITAAGTSQSITWVLGDEARYNGTSGSWTRVSGIYTEVANLRNEMSTRPATDYIYSDGAIANRAILQTPGTRGNLAGAALASWVGWVDVPTANPSVVAAIACISSSATPNLASTNTSPAWSLFVTLRPDGSLLIRQMGASPAANDSRSAYTATTFRSLYSGQRIWLDVRITAGTSQPVLRINGITQSLADLLVGTLPNWLDSSLVATTHLTGHNWPLGPVPLGCWINAHLSDSESDTWRTTGRAPTWVMAGGDCLELISASQDRDFSGAGVGNWTSLIGTATVANTASALDLTLGATGATGVRLASAAYRAVNANYYTRVTFTCTLISGTAPQLRLGYTSGGGEILFTPSGTPTAVSYDFYMGPNNQFTIYSSSSNSSVIRFDDFSTKAIGALSLPRIQPILCVDDITEIGGNAARLTAGMRPISSDRQWRIVGDTATSGNQQLLGGALVDIAADVIETIEQSPASGTPTTYIGHSSGSNAYKSSGTLAAGINVFTPTTRKLATTAIWINSTVSTAIRTTVTGHRTQ